LLTVIIIVAAGFVMGFLLRNHEKIIKPVDSIINWSIYLLLFLLGISVGINQTIINNLDEIGLRATLLTIGAVLGSIILSYFTYILFFKYNEK